MSATIECTSGRFCENPFHKRSRIGLDGLCRVGRAWRREATPCSGCETPVPEHLTLSVNPFALEAIERLPNPESDTGAIRLVTALALEGSDARFCRYCAETLEDSLGARSNRIGTPKGRVTLFETVNARFAARRAKEARYVAFFARLLGPKDMGIVRGARSETPNGALSECTVHANEPDLCVCGGWHPWNRTLAFKAHETNRFGFGPACAEIAERHGLAFTATLRHAVHDVQNEQVERAKFAYGRKRRKAA